MQETRTKVINFIGIPARKLTGEYQNLALTFSNDAFLTDNLADLE